MTSSPAIDQILQLAQKLSPQEKLMLIDHLTPTSSSADQLVGGPVAAVSESLDDQYQHGYERLPEEIADVVALLPHLPVTSEGWE